jgi:hypothetical protein
LRRRCRDLVAFTIESPGAVRRMTPSELALPGYRIVHWRRSFAGIATESYIAFLHHDHGSRNGNGVERFDFTIPYWLAVTATAPAPALWAWRWLRSLTHRRVARRRTARGECPACGYDLRATSGRCPECGKIASASTTG